MKIIVLEGEWETEKVWLNGKRLYPGKSQRVWNHSPNGFNWGYEGSGPAQLALGVLLELLPQEKAVDLHQEFKREVIAALVKDDFRVSMDLRPWLEEKEQGPVAMGNDA
ncbi:hypothetical protein ES703_48926 [subsurface metagenome]